MAVETRVVPQPRHNYETCHACGSWNEVANIVQPWAVFIVSDSFGNPRACALYETWDSAHCRSVASTRVVHWAVSVAQF